ncbi:MAG TPA: M90 family metallopeptidase [Chthoniobacterales bacterium]|jgi:Mlc titration factor MtfA (ptsG expression regulator)|nr:M90 family metallopeptidase [Chthoniobacterales bacterium]
MLRLLRERRRRQLRSRPFPEEWRAIIAGNLPFFSRLTAADQEELLGHVQVFLAEKRFEGCGGLKLSDEIRLTIATQACLLLLHRKTDYYPRLLTILVYPSGFVVERDEPVDDVIWEEGREGRLGETAPQMRSLVLAWDAARYGALDPSDGKNVILHEFAHQLDFEDFVADGVPALGSRNDKRSWAEVMAMEFAALRAADDTGIPTLLDSYGATNPAEFFAVATEAFFERPLALRQRRPQLFAELQRFYRQDPTAYSSEPAAP